MKTIIKLNDKFTINNFPVIINNYFENSLKSSFVLFDLEELEWVSLEALTLLFGWINNIKNQKLDCVVNIKLPSPNAIGTENTTDFEGKKRKRRERRLISLLETWLIRHFCNIQAKDIVDPPNNLNSIIEKRRQSIDYSDSNWKRIIPFRKLDANIYESLENVRSNLDTEINEIFSFEEDITSLLNRFSIQTPFKNKTLSHLITVELFLNTLHHSKRKVSDVNECYFSVSLSNKYNSDDIQEELVKKKIENFRRLNNCSYNDALNKIEPVNSSEVIKELQKRIDLRLPRNIESERLQQTWSFFKDTVENKYLNRSYLEYTFLDFGIGIPESLRDDYLKNIDSESVKSRLSLNHFECSNVDSRILEYAFLLDTSRNPFSENIRIQEFVPRGLYFLLDVLRLYKGLIVVRSNNGEIIFDFSKVSSIKEAVSLSEIDYNFPGAMISIVIPEQTNSFPKIEPVQDIKLISEKKALREYISILDIYRRFQERYISDEPYKSIDLYNHFFQEITLNPQKVINKSCQNIVHKYFAQCLATEKFHLF